MKLNQMNEEFNDAFEYYFPDRGVIAEWGSDALGHAVTAGFRLRNRAFGAKLMTNERIVEYPMVLRWMKEQGDVLEIGCVSSRLPIQLASMGYRIDGLDVRAFGFAHPNLRFHRADLFEWKPDRSYDIILLVSVIEHFGLGGYKDKVLDDADRRAVERLSEWLKPEGQLLVTLPFGAPGVTAKHRIYDMDRLRRVFGGLRWHRQAYFSRKGADWLPSTAEELRNVASPDLPVNGIAVLDFRKQG